VLPEGVSLVFHETVTPDPQAAFSPIQVATRLDASNQPIGAAETFRHPPKRLLAAFTYNYLQDGVRWTSVWYHADQVICLETKPWDGGTGGYGYTECTPTQGWLPGEYEIQMFLGDQWKVSTRFTVEGDQPSASPSAPAAGPTSSPPSP
jgi:hypothetical protein